MTSFRGLAAAGAAVLFLGAALPSLANSPSISCFLAFNSACGHVRPRAAQLEACFDAHSARLARSCGEHLPHFVTVARRCEAEAERFCGHVARVSSLPSCMEHRLAEVGQSCQNALARAGLAPRRPR